MEIAEIELRMNLSSKLRHKLVQDAIRKTLWALRAREVSLPATSIQSPDSLLPQATVLVGEVMG